MKNLLKVIVATVMLSVSFNAAAGLGPVEEPKDPTVIVSTLAGYLTGSVVTTIILMNPAAAPVITAVSLVITIGLYACYYIVCDKIIEWMAEDEIEVSRVSLLV